MTVSRCVAFNYPGWVSSGTCNCIHAILRLFSYSFGEEQISFLLWRIHGKNSFSHFRRTLRGDGRFNDHLSGLCLFVFSNVNRHQNPVFAVTWRLVNQKPRGYVVSKTKHSKTKTEARSTQNSKTKHLKLENEAPKSRKRSTRKRSTYRKRSTQNSKPL